MPKSDGGPVFPIIQGYTVASSGMTLRDYFAAKALQGLLSPGQHNVIGLDRQRDFAELAYALADAMLTQREI